MTNPTSRWDADRYTRTGSFVPGLAGAVLVPDAVTAAMFRALRPGGRLAAEFGGFGNIAAIRTGLRAMLVAFGHRDLPDGLAAWPHTFRGGLFDGLGLGDQERTEVVAATVALVAPALRDPEGTWWADYVRIRVRAERPRAA